jgi:hypothetical protein
VLREAAKSLDMNTDEGVPPMIVLREKQAIAAAQQAAQQEAELMQQQNAAETGARPSAGGAPKGMPSQPKPPGSGQRLVNGAPVADNFQAA